MVFEGTIVEPAGQTVLPIIRLPAFELFARCNSMALEFSEYKSEMILWNHKILNQKIMSELLTMMVATKHANDVVSKTKRQRAERSMRADRRQLLRKMDQNDRRYQDEIAELEQELKISKVAFFMRYKLLAEKYAKLESEHAELKSKNDEFQKLNNKLGDKILALQRDVFLVHNPKKVDLAKQLKQLKVQYSEVKDENASLKKLDKTDEKITFNVLVQLISIIVLNGQFNPLNCTKAFLQRHLPTNLETSRPIRIDDMSHPVIRAFRHVFKSNNNGQSEFGKRLDDLDEKGTFGVKQSKKNSVVLGNFVAIFSAKSLQFQKLNNTSLHKKMGKYFHFGAKICTQTYDWVHQKVLNFVKADPDEFTCFFTGSGVTGGMNRMARVFSQIRPDRNIVLVSIMEHHSNDLPHRKHGGQVVHIPLDTYESNLGCVNIGLLEQYLEQYKDNVEGLQDEMDDAYGKIEELEEVIKELQNDIKSLERRKRDK
mgnify:CR=1 FL=1